MVPNADVLHPVVCVSVSTVSVADVEVPVADVMVAVGVEILTPSTTLVLLPLACSRTLAMQTQISMSSVRHVTHVSFSSRPIAANASAVGALSYVGVN